MQRLLWAAILGLMISAAAPASACSLAATDPARIKEKLAAAIADHLGWDVDRVPVSAVSEPNLQSPLGLGADCSGLSAFHHSAGFRLEDSGCTVEGVAVLMGYWYTNPVYVHAKKRGSC